MFNHNIFSFSGRIGRTEFCLTYLCYLICLFFVAIAVEDGDDWIAIFLLFPLYILISQGAKRCHDRGNSGWWMVIPFYGLVMLFGPSDYGPNEYGDNPKGLGNNEFVDVFNPSTSNYVENSREKA